MKSFVLTSLSVCCILFLTACNSSFRVVAGPGNLGASGSVHEWKDLSHSTTGDFNKWETTSTCGFFTGTIDGGLNDCNEVSVGAKINWDQGE